MRVISLVRILLVGGVFTLFCGGCAAVLGGSEPENSRTMDGAEAGERITSEELDGLTRAFADRYVGLLYSVCEEIKKDNPSAVQRREAQVLLLDCSTNVYDIASNADAFTRVLDLVVVTTLLKQVWVDDGRAMAIFGERGEPLARGMVQAQEEARELAKRVLQDGQLGSVDSLIAAWRFENPEMTAVSFVRFSNFSIGRGRSAAAEVLAARGLFSEIGQASQAVDEVRLLGERVFYRLKREPTLVRWQVEATKEDLLATPETAAALTNLDQLADQFDELPATLSAERQALLAGFADALKQADDTVAGVGAVLDKGREFLAALQPASQSLSKTFETGHALFTQIDEWDRWSHEVQSRPFDIREHTEAIRELATAAEEVDEMLTTSNTLLNSSQWDTRIEEAGDVADKRIAYMADQSESVLDAFFWRGIALLIVLFILLILYRIVSVILMRRYVPGAR